MNESKSKLDRHGISDVEFLRYQRQISLSEIGEHGQEHLATSHVLIIGCGGLGSAAAQFLAAAGVGHLVLVDDDVVESSNLQRQTIYRESDLGMSKAVAMRQQLLNINSNINVRAINGRLDHSQLKLEVMLADVVLDCTDNIPSRQSINKACFELRTDLIFASAIGWQGQFAVFEHSHTFVEPQACYRCVYPFDELPSPRSCNEVGVIGPVVGTLGNYQALAAIQKLTIGAYSLSTRTLHVFDGLSLNWQQLALLQDSDCEVCGVGLSDRSVQSQLGGGA
jgi:sulfur carrier protein ThiS adenylyltransferase